MPAEDGTPIRLSVFTPATADRTAGAPCVYWMHGGGMVMGDRFSQIDIPLEWLDEFGAVVVSVEYRLAPEATGTTLVDDCYQGLLWIAEHAAELGVDPARIVVAGASAGGGLTAGVTLLARDLAGPAIAAQMLICPMLDHRNSTVSSRQYSGGPAVWTREMNEFGWRSVLGDLTDDEVPAYVSPALAEDLSGLPATYIDTGSAEVFRDEDTEYATRIWGPAARPNSMSGQADSTVSTPCTRRHGSRRQPAGPAPSGWPASCTARDEAAARGRIPPGGRPLRNSRRNQPPATAVSYSRTSGGRSGPRGTASPVPCGNPPPAGRRPVPGPPPPGPSPGGPRTPLSGVGP